MKKAKKAITSLDPYSQYRNPLVTRYASKGMVEVFSERHRAGVWRDLWILLAEEEQKLGLPITKPQIDDLRKHRNEIDFDAIRELEVELRHDVMSHLKAYAKVAPRAEGILHLGATSAFITDNADVVILREASESIRAKLKEVLRVLEKQILKWKNLEMAGFTHFQPAQPVTLGKRLSLWAQDLLWDLEELEFCLARLRPLGCKGTTGTQASFLTLFRGDLKKVEALDQAIADRLGFPKAVSVSGQTLSRKVDCWFLFALSNLASSLSKLSYDMRLLQHLRQVMEPFGEKQIGSSAMPYKQNPMLAERISSLSRFLMNLSLNGPLTHGTQWLERSLDDSAARRIVLPEAFLTADALLEITYRLVSGLRVNEKEIRSYLKQHEDSFETEFEMMEATLKGKSRQAMHEEFRKQMLAGALKKAKKSRARLSGAASEQAEAFVKDVLRPALKGRNRALFGAARI